MAAAPAARTGPDGDALGADQRSDCSSDSGSDRDSDQGDALGRADVGRGEEGPLDPGGAPSLVLFLTDLQRAIAEVGLHLAAQPILRSAPLGDGHPVLVLPGFYGDDLSTLLLRRFLRSRGYWTHGWRLGRNLGPTPEVVDGLGQRLDAIVDRHGRPASIIGWSLGGIYARELARRSPEAVRQVDHARRAVPAQPPQPDPGLRAVQALQPPARSRRPDAAAGGRPAAVAGALHRRLLPAGRHRRLAGLRGRARRDLGERGSARQPPRPGAQPVGAVGDRRPAGPAGGGLAAVRAPRVGFVTSTPLRSR